MKYTIVFSVDDNYAQHLAVALTSLLDNNKDILMEIFLLLTDNLSKDNEKKY